MKNRQDKVIRHGGDDRSGGATGSTPGRDWLVLRTSAVLESVATQNYVKYRGCAVPRYPQPSLRDGDYLAALPVDLLLADGEGSPRLLRRGLTLTHRESSLDGVVWRGYQRMYHVQVAWIWDFYRIQSHVMLRTPLGHGAYRPEGAWAEVVRALKTAAPGDLLTVDVNCPAGDIHQAHVLDSMAMIWSG